VSADLCEPSEVAPLLDPLTLILQEIAHASAAREDELRDVLDNLGLVFGCERGEPLCEALSGFSRGNPFQGEGPTTLPCRESRIRYLSLLA
jgi:hypothetical protein